MFEENVVHDWGRRTTRLDVSFDGTPVIIRRPKSDIGLEYPLKEPNVIDE